MTGNDALAGFFDTDLVVFVDGVLVGEDNGAELGADATVTIGSNGALIGQSAGLWLNGAGSVVHNRGTIQSEGDGPSFVDSAVVFNGTSNAAMTNDGAIVGGGVGINMAFSTGTVLTNMGSITANLEAIIGFGGLRLDNTGSITSATTVAVDLSSATTNGLRLVNSGTIKGATVAIEGGAAVDIVRNTGVIDGDVSLSGGNDRLSNWGEIFGDVDLGDDDDLYRGLQDGLVEGVINAGNGDDTVRGGSSDDVMNGQAGNDSLVGGGGDDSLVGEIGTIPSSAAPVTTPWSAALVWTSSSSQATSVATASSASAPTIRRRSTFRASRPSWTSPISRHGTCARKAATPSSTTTGETSSSLSTSQSQT